MIYLIWRSAAYFVFLFIFISESNSRLHRHRLRRDVFRIRGGSFANINNRLNSLKHDSNKESEGDRSNDIPVEREDNIKTEDSADPDVNNSRHIPDTYSDYRDKSRDNSAPVPKKEIQNDLQREHAENLSDLANSSFQEGIARLSAEDQAALKKFAIDRMPPDSRAKVIDSLRKIAENSENDHRVHDKSIDGSSEHQSPFRTAEIFRLSDEQLQEMNSSNRAQPEITMKLVQHHLLILLLIQIPQILATHFFGAVGSMIGMTWARKLITGSNVRSKKGLKDKKYVFDDVVGCDEAKEEVKQVVDFLIQPEKYAKLGAKIPRGILLVGPPGTGKTLLAKACAGEAGVPFLYSSGSDYNTMFAGQGVDLVKQQFSEARKHKRAIIFIDELDYVGKKRSNNANAQQSVTLDRESTLTQLLAEMDGFSPNEGVVVIATTNRADMLDPALLRSGRFGMAIEVEAPDKLGRQQLFARYLKNLELDITSSTSTTNKEYRKQKLPSEKNINVYSMEKRTESINLNISPNRGPMKVLRAFGRLAFFVLFVPYGPLLLPLLSNRNRAQMQKRNFNLEPKNEILEESKGEGVRWSIANELAGLTPGLVGADIEEICNVAAISAAKNGSSSISMDNLSDAVDRVRGGIEKKTKKVTHLERQRTAIHEAGHAIVGWMLPYADIVNKVSIVWRGSALGFTQSLPSERVGNMREHFIDHVCVCLAGRAAEEVCLGGVSDGAAQDLKQATDVIREMITRFGFGKSIGLFSPSDWSTISQSTARKIDEEIQALLTEQYQRAKAIVVKHQHHIHALETLLLDKEVVRGDCLANLLGEKVTQERVTSSPVT